MRGTEHLGTGAGEGKMKDPMGVEGKGVTGCMRVDGEGVTVCNAGEGYGVTGCMTGEGKEDG